MDSLAAGVPKPSAVSDNDYGQGILDVNSRTVSVADILLGGSSDDEDDLVPIVKQLPQNLSLLASVAAPSPKLRQKRKPKSLWSYQTVTEPMSAVSNYWDAEAPSERAMKRLAKERLLAIQQAEITRLGTLYLLCLLLYGA
jgi:hypothetical protein